MEARIPLTRAASFISFLWMVHLLNMAVEMDLCVLGVHPREFIGIPGIFFSAFLHANFGHIVSNSLGLICLLIVMYDAYGARHTNSVILEIIFLSGLLLWVFGRGGAVHVGASGLIYGLFTYIPISAIRYKKRMLLVFAVFIVVFNGSQMLSGMITMSKMVSWEAHLMGAVTGVMLALFEDRSTPLPTEKGDDDETRSHCLQGSRSPQDSGMAAKEMPTSDSD